MSDPSLAQRLARNLRRLREGRGLTQQQMARLSGLPRATWAHLESGDANPTLAVLNAVAQSFQTSLEELVATPRAACAVQPVAGLPTRVQGQGRVRKLMSDPVMAFDRFELPAGGRMPGVPHAPGTRELLTCEAGEIVLSVSGERFRLAAGDVASFRGDLRHAYANPGKAPSIGYSVVVLGRE